MPEARKEIALAISGGGYRSTLFALGSLWRLNEFSLLPSIDRITSVSGGSIISAFLAMKWRKLRFESSGVADNFVSLIATPMREFCSKTLDIPAVLWGLVPDGRTAGDRLADLYSRHLFGKTALRDLPKAGEGPEFIFYAASLQTGAGVRISRDAIRDYKVGALPIGDLSLARAVGASSAFPPIFSPVTIRCNPSAWKRLEGAYLYDDIRFRKRLILTDGGVYDNMGLEAVWNDGFKSVLVCDAGAPWKNIPTPAKNWFGQLLRVFSVVGAQTGALRKRTLIENFLEKDASGNPLHYGGTYWGIATEINDYGLSDSMLKDNAKTDVLRNVRTRLNRFSPEEQGNLINWGYALTDTAMRRWYFKDPKPTGVWPVPEYALDR
jgi:NTE family protein